MKRNIAVVDLRELHLLEGSKCRLDLSSNVRRIQEEMILNEVGRVGMRAVGGVNKVSVAEETMDGEVVGIVAGVAIKEPFNSNSSRSMLLEVGSLQHL